MNAYWSEPIHNEWSMHYIKGMYGGRLLMFTDVWRAFNLPEERQMDGLCVRLLDTQDGKKYDTREYVAYEAVWDADYAVTLQDYFYGSHFCQCHRKSAAIKAGADTDEECEGNRFVVDRITAPNLPDLILYSETIPIEKLEAALLQTK